MQGRYNQKKENPHVRHQHNVALLIIDMLNTLEFPQSEKLLKAAIPAARAIATLKTHFKDKKIPVIYVNDNFGQWRSDWKSVYEVCASEKSKGQKLAKILKPHDDDYFVLKPKHSGFYSTTLDVLLEALGTETLILTGIAGNICVLFTANDAHMREFKVIVPRNCIASNTTADNNFVLRQLKEVFKIETPTSKHLMRSKF